VFQPEAQTKEKDLMNCSRRLKAALVASLFLIVASFVAPAGAQNERPRKAETPAARPSAKQLKEAEKKARAAAKVFDEIMDAPDSSVPKELLDRAEAVAVFPGVLKAGLLVGGRGGSGVISRRIAGGWSAPAYFKLTGGSVGMNEPALKGLLEDKFEIGGEASAAAGPVGRAASATTNVTLDAGLLSYSRSRGLFAGLELKGAWINPDNNLNEALYGLKARAILTGDTKIKMADVPSGVIVFPNALGRYSLK
jgi:lipid-binding SYLF domain-containing protein